MNASALTSDSSAIDRCTGLIGVGYKPQPAAMAVKDTGRVKIGAGYKLLPTA